MARPSIIGLLSLYLSSALLGCGATAGNEQRITAAPPRPPGARIPPPDPDLAARAGDPPDPERITMLAPDAGSSRRQSNVEVAPHRPRIPDGRSGIFWGLYKVCVGYDGLVYKVRTIKTAGSDIDFIWSDAIRTWRYTPYVVDGQPVAFCHPLRVEVRVQ